MPAVCHIRKLIIFINITFFITLSNVFAEEGPQLKKSNLILEIRSGLLSHDVDNLWSNSRKERGVDINGEIILNLLNRGIFNGIIRPNIGLSVNTSGQTSKLYSGVTWERELQSHLIINFGIGIAVHNGELDNIDPNKKALGSRVLFHIPVEFGYKLSNPYRIFFFFDHVSNANLSSPNEGMDTLGIRVGYRF